MKSPDAVLELEIKYLREAHEKNEQRIIVLEAYKAKTERYGWFLLGVIALGTMLAAGFEKVVEKILMVTR